MSPVRRNSLASSALSQDASEGEFDVSLVVYGVVANGNGWSIDHQGHRVGCWRERSEAEAEAARLVREADRLGHQALLQAPAGTRSLRWAI